MRHRDGLFDIVGKIKEKCSELIRGFRALPPFRKVALLLGRLMQAVGAILLTRGSSNIINELKLVRTLNNEVYEEWKKAQDQFDAYAESVGMSEEDRVAQSPSPNYVNGKYAEGGMRLLKGLVSALIGSITVELAKSNTRTDSRARIRYRDSISDLSSRIKTKFMEYVDYLRHVEYAKPIVKMLLNVIKLAQEVSSPTDSSEYVKSIKRLYTAKKDLALSFIPEKIFGNGDGFRLAWLKAGRKIILGLTEALSGYVADSLISKKICQVESFEAYGRQM